LLGVQFAKAMGYRVFGIDAVEKRETCIESGVDLFIDTCNPAEIPKKILELTPGGLGVNAVLNVATSIKAIETSLQYLRPRGTAVLIAIPPEEMKVDLFHNIMKSITIKCSLVGNRQVIINHF
jgi:propanol-preferring alcohol dehydrogenase